ncbi:MAG TPA: cob(I)yrinic acid a,c-diamide adenosyltransferase [Candidatus Magasanikbacteria bacterium]|nr:cob(I)yrinic acid a,c-diamide adenosyltransferase [Candidatus Magasanikbacteria bacterium]
MTKIYTKIGDKGKTSLLGGRRVEKNCIELDAIGEVDELNAWLGVLGEEMEEGFATEAKAIGRVQDRLFVVGSILASLQIEMKLPISKITTRDVLSLEKWIDRMQKELPELRNFIIPGGTEEAVKCFYARAICRRAERRVVQLNQEVKVPENVLRFMNRLSDLLFVLGRWCNYKSGQKEILWGGKK